ncbi:phosphonate ABC transporter, permease protein PhnE [Fructilactobacillus hinvesii]|uniref:Phosphonate ABC transporter, permease protein PhnE n=1 Tax=Fructilactobacillus hinvesii TaxID=2940300 RepID=A0ABY5BU13_9LACO|nr:phosphonate ABC transporter, permease protein PhnE [Fructilactobacillus hinvesii]USS88440.1 phosphonate ABC transporter, permease protein PhnE [Fructilactobacillus hinvesii]
MNKTKTTALERFKWIVVALLVIFIYLWSINGIPFTGIQKSASSVSMAILKGIIHPEWSYVYNGSGEDLVSQLVITLAIAFLGTIISAFLSVPLAFLAAQTTKKFFHPRSTIGKVILTAIRAFPEVVLAILFIKMVGPGSFAGVLAIGVHSVGMLGKLFSEAIEEMDRSAETAIIAAGGSKIQTFRIATLPTILPALMSYTLYRFEISVRSASILGLVGAGGIGTPMMFALQTRDWSKTGIILLGIVLMVIVIDTCSSTIRKRLG